MSERNRPERPDVSHLMTTIRVGHLGPALLALTLTVVALAVVLRA